MKTLKNMKSFIFSLYINRRKIYRVVEGINESNVMRFLFLF